VNEAPVFESNFGNWLWTTAQTGNFDEIYPKAATDSLNPYDTYTYWFEMQGGGALTAAFSFDQTYFTF